MKSLPKVSVIIPVYNVAPFLKQCLNSVLFQSLKEIEIICINDGSTDTSLQILKQYAQKDARIHLINQHNQGVSIARNNGIAKASGEYIYCLDSDDYIAQDALEKMYAIAKENKLDMLHFTAQLVDKKGNEIETPSLFRLDVLPEGKEGVVLSAKDCYDFVFSLAINMGLSLFKRAFLQKNKILFPKGICFEDNPFFFKALLSAKRILFLKKPFYFYRISENSITGAKDLRQYDLIKAYRIMVDFLKENKLYNTLQKSFLSRQIKRLLDASLTIQKPYKEGLINRCGDYFKALNLSPEDIKLWDLREQSFYKQCLKKQTIPEISIVLSVYHTMPALERCLKTLTAQSFTNFEVLCFGPEKRGKTRPFLEKYIKRDNRVSFDEAPFSMADIRNEGLKRAKGKYILFLDAFDSFDWRILERLHLDMEQTKADVSVCRSTITDPLYNRTMDYPLSAQLRAKEKPPALYAPVLFNKIFRVSFLKENNVTFVASRTTEDVDFWNAFFAANPKCSAIFWLLITHPVVPVRDAFNETTLFFKEDPVLYKPASKIRQFVKKLLRPFDALYQAHLNALRAFHKDQVPVVLITDKNYAFPTMMTILSLQKTKKPERHFDIFVITTGLDRRTRKCIASLSTKQVPVHVYPVRNKYKKYQKTNNPITPTALFKFDIPTFLKTYDKALYLDSDMLVTRDLSDLTQRPLINKYAAVVKDMIGTDDANADRLHLTAYFNSGFMLLNLAKMRADFIPEQLVMIKQKDPWHYFMDQDAFNVAFREKVDYLSPTYNYMLGNRMYSAAQMGDFYGFSAAEIKQIRKQPAILHYSSQRKPWRMKTDYYTEWMDVYHHVLNTISYQSSKKTPRFIRHFVKAVESIELSNPPQTDTAVHIAKKQRSKLALKKRSRVSSPKRNG